MDIDQSAPCDFPEFKLTCSRCLLLSDQHIDFTVVYDKERNHLEEAET